MAEDEVDPDVIDELNKRADEDDAELPEDIEVPLGVSDEEAVKAVKQQFKDAGTECSDDEALTLVKAAQRKAEKKKDKKDDDKNGEKNDEKADDKNGEKNGEKNEESGDTSDDDSEGKADE